LFLIFKFISIGDIGDQIMRFGLILPLLLGAVEAAGIVAAEDSLRGHVAAEDSLREGEPRSEADGSLMGRILDTWRSLRDDKIFFFFFFFPNRLRVLNSDHFFQRVQ
jgi:hypothetical protein